MTSSNELPRVSWWCSTRRHSGCDGWTAGLYETYPCECACGCAARTTEADKPRPGRVLPRTEA